MQKSEMSEFLWEVCTYTYVLCWFIDWGDASPSASSPRFAGASPRNFSWRTDSWTPKPTCPQSLLLEFRPLYFDNVRKMQNKIKCQEKDTEISSILVGRPPQISRLWGTRPPALELDAHALSPPTPNVTHSNSPKGATLVVLVTVYGTSACTSAALGVLSGDRDGQQKRTESVRRYLRSSFKKGLRIFLLSNWHYAMFSFIWSWNICDLLLQSPRRPYGTWPWYLVLAGLADECAGNRVVDGAGAEMCESCFDRYIFVGSWKWISICHTILQRSSLVSC